MTAGGSASLREVRVPDGSLRESEGLGPFKFKFVTFKFKFGS